MAEGKQLPPIDTARMELLNETGYVGEVRQALGIEIDTASFVLGTAYGLLSVAYGPANAHASFERNADEFRKLAAEIRKREDVTAGYLRFEMRNEGGPPIIFIRLNNDAKASDVADMVRMAPGVDVDVDSDGNWLGITILGALPAPDRRDKAAFANFYDLDPETLEPKE